MTLTRALVEKIGLDKLKEVCLKSGLLKAARELSELSGYRLNKMHIAYLFDKYGWVRVVSDIDSPMAKAVLNQKYPVTHYKRIMFSEEILNELQKYR